MIIDKDGAIQEKECVESIPESDEDLKMQLLHLAKEVLQHKAHMRWETHKQCEDITIDMLIDETRKLYSFVTEIRKASN